MFMSALSGTVKGVKMVARAGTHALTLGGAIPLPASGLFLGRGSTVPRGYLLVYDVVNGALLMQRRVEGSMVSPTLLSKAHSYVTALAFAPDGGTLYAACGRGMLHVHVWETDEGRMAAAPMRTHAVIFGEVDSLGDGLRQMRNLGAQAKNAFDDFGANLLGLDAGGIAGGNGGGGAAAAAATAAAAGGGGSGEAGAERGAPFFHKLFFKRDRALGVPLLVALDSTNAVRAFTVPPPPEKGLLEDYEEGGGGAGETGEEAARAAFSVAVKANAALVKGLVAVGTAGLVQVNTAPQAVELSPPFVSYLPGEVGPGGRGGHALLAPMAQSDSLAVVSADREVAHILQPHGRDASLGTLPPTCPAAVAAAAAAVGAGVTSAQVVARLAAGEGLTTALAVSPDDQFVVTGHETGTLAVWKRQLIRE
jgi:hypothetical protein